MKSVTWKHIKNVNCVQLETWEAEKIAYKRATGRELKSNMMCLEKDSFDFDECEFFAEELWSFGAIVDRLTDYAKDTIHNNVVCDPDLPEFLGGLERGGS